GSQQSLRWNKRPKRSLRLSWQPVSQVVSQQSWSRRNRPRSRVRSPSLQQLSQPPQHDVAGGAAPGMTLGAAVSVLGGAPSGSAIQARDINNHAAFTIDPPYGE